MADLSKFSREELEGLVEDFAKRWLAHDGLWFLSIEKSHGIDFAIEKDKEAMGQFTVIEARRIMKLLGLREGGGLEALKKALGYRLYAFINKQEIIHIDNMTLQFRMIECRVQSARKRKNLPDFPCKPVGQVEYENFAKTIDGRIETRCIACPPDSVSDEYNCAWEFTIRD